jgi:Flp pilus assembly protein TadG
VREVALSIRSLAAIRRVATIHDGRRARDESGQVIVIVALMMTLFLLCAAVVVNIGSWYDTDSGLQKAADLSAVAGAQYIATGGSLGTANPSYPCTSANLLSAGLTVDAAGCASYVAGLNGISLPETATPVTLPGNQGIRVTTQHLNQAGIFFQSNRTESAVAVVTPVGGAPNSFFGIFRRPFGGFAYGLPVTFTFRTFPARRAVNLLQSCGQNPSEQQLIDCIDCVQTYSVGAGRTLTPIPITGCQNPAYAQCAGDNDLSDPGDDLNNNVVNEINQKLDDQIALVPVYTRRPVPQGTDFQYLIAGFAALQFGTPAASGGDPGTPVTLNGTFLRVVAPSDIQGSCTGSGGNFGVTTFYLAG